MPRDCCESRFKVGSPFKDRVGQVLILIRELVMIA
jgi:hypothetical protein